MKGLRTPFRDERIQLAVRVGQLILAQQGALQIGFRGTTLSICFQSSEPRENAVRAHFSFVRGPRFFSWLALG